MRRKPTPTKDSTATPLEERRAAPQGKGAANPLKRLKGALGRPVALQWRDGQPHVVLVERRSAAQVDREQAHLCAELRARLLAQGAEETSKLLHTLVVVHDKLTRKGWEGVRALPAAVLAKAIRQADMLAQEDPSPALTKLAERLRCEHAAAVARDQAKAQHGEDDDAHAPQRIEVKEASYKEFEELERSWTHTVPSDLAPLSAQG